MIKRMFKRVSVWVHRLLHTEKTEQQVTVLKQQMTDKSQAAATSVKRSGELQREVFTKTTTYFIGRASGSIRKR